jgi:hypothetical protein
LAVGDVLCYRMSRLVDPDRPTDIPIHYVRPGELRQMDASQLGPISDASGRHIRGRGQGTPRAQSG